MKMKQYSKKKNQLSYYNILVYLKIYDYFKNMVEEHISQEWRLKNVDETQNYFLEEVEQMQLMSNKYKKVCTALNYIENILISASAVTGYISISAFASSLVVPKGIMSSAIVLKICEIAVKIKKYPSIIKKKEKKHDKK